MSDFKAPGPGLATALVAAQKAMPRLTKDAKADTGAFSYRYLSLETLLGQVLPVLNANGIAVLQSPTVSVEHGDTLRTTLWHESGDEITTVMRLPVARDATAQALGSAITYCRRYSLLALLGLAPDEDDDGAAAQPKHNGTEAAAATPKQHAKHNALLGVLQEKDPKAEGQRSWEDEAKALVYERFGKRSRAQLTVEQMDELIAWTQGFLDMAEVPFS